MRASRNRCKIETWLLQDVNSVEYSAILELMIMGDRRGYFHLLQTFTKCQFSSRTHQEMR